jgi:CheY-like chemotaxis protein
MTREMLVRTLTREGWKTTEAENGRIALDRVAEAVPDLILLDLMMPEVDGFQVIRMLRSHAVWRTIPVVVVTAMELSPEERQFLDGYVSRILQKASYSREELLQEVCDLVLASVLS